MLSIYCYVLPLQNNRYFYHIELQLFFRHGEEEMYKSSENIARKGFPNSYLTKSEIVNLEFPKYSTSVGLLLWEFADDNRNSDNSFKTSSSLPKVNNFGKLVTERIKGFLKDDDLTEFKDENL